MKSISVLFLVELQDIALRLEKAKQEGLKQICITDPGVSELIQYVQASVDKCPEEIWAYLLDDTLFLLNKEQHLFLNGADSTPVCKL